MTTSEQHDAAIAKFRAATDPWLSLTSEQRAVARRSRAGTLLDADPEFATSYEAYCAAHDRLAADDA